MIEFTYIAKRSLKAGTAIDDVVDIEVNVTDYQAGRNVNKSSSESLGGRTQQNLLSVKKTWAVAIYRTDGIDAADMFMFMDSVIGGEIFVLTDYDTGEVYNVQMIDSYTTSRITTFQQSDFKYGFSIKEV